MEKRLFLSLIALIGSVFLFIVASFAWLVLSRYVDIDLFNANVGRVSIDSRILVSPDDQDYSETQAIDFRGALPGSKKYYQVEISNTQDYAIQVNVFLSGFSTLYTGENEEPNDLTLYEVLEFDSFLDGVQVIPVDYLGVILSDQPDLIEARISISEDFIIQPGETRIVSFSFGLDGSVGNEYSYKGISINNISILFDQFGGDSWKLEKNYLKALSLFLFL